MRSLPLRILVIAGALVVIGGAAWALPAAEGDRPSLVSGSADDTASAPDIDLPQVTDDAAREVAPAASPTTTQAPAAATAAPTTSAEPDHLVAATPAPAAEPEPVVTTTTAPPTTTTAAPVVTIAFTATQAYGSCGEAVPYDIFSGQGTPGSTVSISSPYGSGSTTVDSSGHWEKTVEFPTAPRGETFAVTASGLGGSTTLHFTATGGVDH